MGSSRKHRDKERERSRSRSKSKDKYEKSDKSDRNHRSSHRHKDKESSSGSRKRQRGDNTSDDDRNDLKKLKVKEVKDVLISKSSNSSVNKTVKLDQKSSDVSDRTNRRDGHQTKEDSQQTEGSNTESLSVEETNKLRIKLGLKPLDVTSSDDKTGDKMETKEVFVKTEKMSDKIEAEKIKEKIEVQRNKRKIVQKLRTVKGLADSDSDKEEDSSAWVMKSRKLAEEKATAAKRAQLLEEMDEEFGVSTLIDEDLKKKKAMAYTSRHLKGLTVGHKEEDFKEGQQVVLTLKDKAVLDEDEDVLENVNIIDDKKAKTNIDNKLRRPEYRPYDEPELDEFGILKTKSMLSKYDEEISGPKKDAFRLGVTPGNRSNDIELIRMKLKQEEGKISLFTTKPKIASEYFTEEEMTKFKKPKKVRKVLRKKKAIEATEEVVTDLTVSTDHGSRKSRNRDKEMNIDSNDTKIDKTIVKEEVLVDINPIMLPKSGLRLPAMDVDEDFIDPNDEDLSGIILEEEEADKELEMALHKSRKLKLRSNVEATTGAASIAKVAETVQRLNDVNDDSNDAESLIPNNIILNSTAEFCRNLGDIPTYGLAGNRDEDEELMELEETLIETRNPIHDSDPNRGQWNEVEVKEDDIAQDLEDNEGQPILEEEPDVSRGLVGALQLAMKKGYLDKEVKKVSASRQSAIESQSYTIEEKFYEDDKIGRRERYSGPVSDFREKNEYRPEIKLDYVDEKGRVLDQKEAFRHLSHKFHGKGPSKNKIDKRMKKKDQQSKLQQMSSTDTPLNTLKMLTDKQKELQLPYVVLTGAQKTAIQTTISKTK